MIYEFKHSMKGEIVMTDSGRMRYFLGIELNQSKDEFFIHQQKYEGEVLSGFSMEECNKECT